MPLSLVCLLIWYSWPKRTIFRPLSSAYPEASCYCRARHYRILVLGTIPRHISTSFLLALAHVLLLPFLTTAPGHMLFSVAGKQPKCVTTWLRQVWHEGLEDQRTNRLNRTSEKLILFQGHDDPTFMLALGLRQ